MPAGARLKGDTLKLETYTLFLKAVRYVVNEWKAVCRYVHNGMVEIANNAAERI